MQISMSLNYGVPTWRKGPPKMLQAGARITGNIGGSFSPFCCLQSAPALSAKPSVGTRGLRSTSVRWRELTYGPARAARFWREPWQMLAKLDLHTFYPVGIACPLRQPLNRPKCKEVPHRAQFDHFSSRNMKMLYAGIQLGVKMSECVTRSSIPSIYGI